MGSQDLSQHPSQGAEQPGHRNSPGPEQCAPPWGWRWMEARTSVYSRGSLKKQTGSFAHNPRTPNFCQTVTYLLPRPLGICPSIITSLPKFCNLSTHETLTPPGPVDRNRPQLIQQNIWAVTSVTLWDCFVALDFPGSLFFLFLFLIMWTTQLLCCQESLS